MALHEVDPFVASSLFCISSEVTDYVSKAVRLGTDGEYRTRVASAIRQRKHRIYDDAETSFEWARFLARATGVRVTPEELALEEEFHRGVIRMQQKRWKRAKQEQFVLSQ